MLLQNNKFESNYATVEFNPLYNIVTQSWKAEAYGEEFKKPFYYALSLLSFNRGSSYILDLSNGFVEIDEDLDWAFNELFPQISSTGCSKMVFVVPLITGGDNNNDLGSVRQRYISERLLYTLRKKLLVR